MSGGRIQVERRTDAQSQGVVVITINRPEALNSLTREMIVDLARVFAELSEDPSVRVVCLTGAGRAFCAGVDLTAASSVFQGNAFDNEHESPVAQMAKCSFPIIGVINGAAVTAGLELALACDILIASTKARFADTHCVFGIAPGWGLSQKLPRMIAANRARDFSFSGKFITGETAEKWGLVSQVVEPERLMAVAIAFASTIAKNHQKMVKHYKRVLNDGLGMPLKEALQMEQNRAQEYYATMGPDAFEKMKKFIASRSAAAEKETKKPSPAKDSSRPPRSRM
ncbi:hypothetical protein CBR_g58690 [Chara braunii]|uniref:Enoyl-CoA hydratase n=1 Tax=Chara braunii TaxID=69332 RepID=A0A388MEU2_CHABU|nr:hypothetical protein CBR_g58690 [Chara braunii]|eukprot:GBG93071.1 hypothetical protein CBR_g58690 [Chara braunii]